MVLFKMLLESCPWGCWREARQRWEAFVAATGEHGAWQFLKASPGQGEEAGLWPEGRTGSQCTVCREMGYKLVRRCCRHLREGRRSSSQLWMLGAGPWKGGTKGLRLEWKLSSGTHRALPSQSTLAGAPPPPADYKLLCDFLPLPW